MNIFQDKESFKHFGDTNYASAGVEVDKKKFNFTEICLECKNGNASWY